MWICLDCYNTFEKPKKCYGEMLEHFGTPCQEKWIGSPCCDGAFTEAYICELCDEHITEDYFKDDDGNRYCESHLVKYKFGEEI